MSGLVCSAFLRLLSQSGTGLFIHFIHRYARGIPLACAAGSSRWLKIFLHTCILVVHSTHLLLFSSIILALPLAYLAYLASASFKQYIIIILIVFITLLILQLRC